MHSTSTIASKAKRFISLAWMELRTILAKLHFTYDLKLQNDNLDWQRDSEMYTLWKKPELKVKVMHKGNQ